MSFAAKAYRRMLYKMVGIQGLFISILIAGSYLIWGMEHSFGLLYGGAVTMLITLYSGWRFKLDSERTDKPSAMLASLYKGTLLRFLLAIALLILGFKVFALAPADVILGFVVTQAGYFFGPLTARWGRQ